jgi:hypothetical protein
MAQIMCNKISEIGPHHVAFQNEGRLVQPAVEQHAPARGVHNVQPIRAAEEAR